MTAVTPAVTAALASDVDKATALYNESLTYLRLASDHAKFIRNYFDPTQEQLFRMADALAMQLDQLRMEICGFTEPVPPAVINDFVRKAGPVIQQLINFKNRVVELVRTCQTQQILPADFIEHLRREADFFLGIVNHVMGQPTPTRETLGLPGPPQARVATIARTLIDLVPFPEVLAADLAYTEFWTKHHKEHADVLTMFLRPQQPDLIERAARFRDQFGVLEETALDVERQPTVARIQELDRATAALSTDWRNFLLQTEQAQRTCSLQANFPQRLTEHIRIETDILLEAVARAARRLQTGGVPITPTAAAGATYQNLTPKSILCS